MKTYQEVLADADGDYLLSLNKMIGVEVKDIYGYIIPDFGAFTFKICRVILDDGRELGCEGEHDMPYLTTFLSWPVPELEEEALQNIERTNPNREEA